MNDDGRPRRSRGVKNITLVGNLGSDPDKRFTQNGREYSSFSMAVNDNVRGPDGQWTEHADWFRITAWGRLAEIANQYLTRGSRIYVSGRFRTRDWQGNDGQTRTSMEVSASELLMLSGDRESSSGAPPDRASRPSSGAVESWERAGRGQSTQPRPADSPQPRPADSPQPREKEIDIDDLPF